MNTFGTGPTFETDFNDISPEGLVTATRIPGSFGSTFGQGDLALVSDADGNSCWGRIESVAGPLYFLRPIWESWMPATAYQITGDPANVIVESRTELAAV
jgi:hypothetical protein